MSRLLSTLKRDQAIVSVITFLIGSVAASIWPTIAGVVGLVVLVILVINRLLQLRRAEPLSAFELALRQPDRDALFRLSLENANFLVFDKVIEVLPHQSLSTLSGLSNLGWDPCKIGVYFSGEFFDATDALEFAGGKRPFNPPNGRKFSLVDRSISGTDDLPTLHLKETDFFTLESIKPAIMKDPEVRAKLGSLDPARNHIPHSLCLHFLIRFSDGNVLCLYNDKRKAYGGGTWSVSAEEQLKDLDLQSLAPIETLFRRAVLEEVFGLSNDQTPVDQRWAQVSDTVSSLRIWSLFLEEHINNFSLLGVCQLSIVPDVFVQKYNQFVSQGSVARDLEGSLHIVEKNQLQRILIVGWGTARELFGTREPMIRAEKLHWTSRYRIFRLLRALEGRALQPPSQSQVGWVK